MPKPGTANRKKVDVNHIKKRLMAYREDEREIEIEMERIDNLSGKVYSIGSPTLSDMPKPPNVNADRMPNMVIVKLEVEEKTRNLINQHTIDRQWIEELLSYIKKAHEREVIRIRYIDGESWTKVCEYIYGKREDFEERHDTYMRNITRIHGRALRNMALHERMINQCRKVR